MIDGKETKALIRQLNNGEIEPIGIYRKIRIAEKNLKNLKQASEKFVIDKVHNNPGEYRDITLSTRQTFDYKQDEEYRKLHEQLKEREKKLKIASEMNMKGDSYIDGDGVVVEPVDIKYTEVLTFKPKK